MRFWDSSAVVPLLIDERSTDAVRQAFAADPEVVAWWATELECVSALAGREREGDLDPVDMAAAISRLDRVAAGWNEVEPSGAIRRTAVRLVRSHAVRTADALQLAAAIIASEQDPSTLSFVTLDRRLAEVARREGFPVLVPDPG